MVAAKSFLSYKGVRVSSVLLGALIIIIIITNTMQYSCLCVSVCVCGGISMHVCLWMTHRLN